MAASPSRLMLRRLRRHLGQLPCEWCGRFDDALPGMHWAEVPFDDWVDYAREHPVFICHRELCHQRHRECGGTKPRRDDKTSTTPPPRRASGRSPVAA